MYKLLKKGRFSQDGPTGSRWRPRLIRSSCWKRRRRQRSSSASRSRLPQITAGRSTRKICSTACTRCGTQSTTTGETRVFCQDRLVSTRKNDPLPRQARDTYTRGTKIKLKRLRLFILRSVHVYTSPAEQQQALLADIDADPKQRFGTDGTNARNERRVWTEVCYVVSCRVCPELVMAKTM